MRLLHFLIGLLLVPGFAAEEPSRERVVAALGVMIDEPAALGTDRYVDAAKLSQAVFTAEMERLASLPEEMLEWVPSFGPCGGPGSPLLIAFFASLIRDHLQGKDEGSIHRGWLAAIRHYRYLRATYPEAYTPEPKVEALTKKEAAGVLRKEGSELEANARTRPVSKDRAPTRRDP